MSHYTTRYVTIINEENESFVLTDMAKYKYDYRYKTLSIPLFEEDKTIIYDCLCIYNNTDVNSLQIYNRIRFDRKYVMGFPICYSFTDTKCEEAVRSRMKEIMQKNPHVSSSELIKITGHSRPTIIRHYMTLKREIQCLND